MFNIKHRKTSCCEALLSEVQAAIIRQEVYVSYAAMRKHAPQRSIRTFYSAAIFIDILIAMPHIVSLTHIIGEF